MADLLLSMEYNPLKIIKHHEWHTEILDIAKNKGITIILDLYRFDNYCFIIKTILVNGEITPSNISIVRISKTSSRKITEFRIYSNTFDRNVIKPMLIDHIEYITKKVESNFWKSKYSEIKFGNYKLYMPSGCTLIEVCST